MKKKNPKWELTCPTCKCIFSLKSKKEMDRMFRSFENAQSQEIKDLNASLDLFSDCLQRAAKLWHEHNPKAQKHIWPDAADNLAWLFDWFNNKISTKDKQLKLLEKEFSALPEKPHSKKTRLKPKKDYVTKDGVRHIYYEYP